jgi:hypothetical protein
MFWCRSADSSRSAGKKKDPEKNLKIGDVFMCSGGINNQHVQAPTIKVFQVSETDWFAAADADSAVIAFKDFYSIDDQKPPLTPTQLEDDWGFDGKAVELSAEKMQTMRFDDTEENKKRSFAEQLAKMIAEGQNFPCFFASSEY